MPPRREADKYHVMTMRWPLDIWTNVKHYADQHRTSVMFAATHLIGRGLEYERTVGRYTIPTPEIGCRYAQYDDVRTPCGGPVDHVVIYRGPSGREKERVTVCDTHRAEAMNRPRMMGARMLAELEPLPDLDEVAGA